MNSPILLMPLDLKQEESLISGYNFIPKVSVIIATYNRLEYLSDALSSVLLQSFKDFEVIVSDDASSVDVKGLVDRFNDPRIRYYRHEENLGAGANKAFAFSQARGELIASLDDDDSWEPDYLFSLVQILADNPALIMAACDHYIMDSDGNVDLNLTQENTKRWNRDRLKEGIYQPFQKLALVDRSIFTASAAVIRRTMIPWHELELVGVYWDFYLAYLASRDGFGFYYLPQYLVNYRIHEQSETSLSGGRNVQAKIRKGTSDIACHTAFLNDDRLAEFHPIFRKRLAHAQVTLGIGLLRDGQLREARSYIQQSFKNAISLRSIGSFLLTFIPSKYSDCVVKRMSGS